ncbi:hypothetical protein CRUP_022173 [Coryphaenoides rupestris]|nr:hypothetical protein CRUP_022173 [Coryphaenoides rupestris]
MLLELEEEGVEASPRCHYGLLGSGAAGLLVPRGRLQDLPEEVLRQILLLLPGPGPVPLRGTGLHFLEEHRPGPQGQSVLPPPEFAPYKKQYFRYSMGEEGTVAEVMSILEDRGVLDKNVPQESVRRLGLHMPGERLSPEDLMRCIEGHRLCRPALSCLTLRFPNLPRQAPNPYAAMAIILVLSEAVSDVQALVCRLADHMSRAAVVEFLSHMATYLLAMTQNHVRISNR